MQSVVPVFLTGVFECDIILRQSVVVFCIRSGATIYTLFMVLAPYVRVLFNWPKLLVSFLSSTVFDFSSFLQLVSIVGLGSFD